MRKILGYLTAALLAVMLLATVVAGCGGTKAGAQAGPTTPEGILNQAMSSTETITSGTGRFDLTLSVRGDQATMPAEVKLLLAQPISLNGTVAFSQEPMTLDLAMTASLAGQSLPLGLKVTDGKAWIQFMGVWYEAPAELSAAMSTSTTDAKTTVSSLLQALKDAGVDPVGWLTGLTLTGEEEIDGVKAYHLTGNVDMGKVVSDALKIFQDKDLQSALPGLGSMGDTAGTLPVPGDTELKELEAQVGAMFQAVKVDVWVGKDTYQLRKATVDATIVPPDGEGSDGIEAITLAFGFSMDPAGSPVNVTAPTGARPFSELEQAVGALMGLFSGALGGGLTTPETAQ